MIDWRENFPFQSLERKSSVSTNFAPPHPWFKQTESCSLSSAAKSLQSCLTLCDPMDCGPPSSSIYGILQARILKWASCPPPEDLPDPWIEPAFLTCPVLAGRFFATGTIWEAHTQTWSRPDLAHYFLWLSGYFSDVSFRHRIPSCKRRETMSAMTHHHVPRANQKYKCNNDLFNYYLIEENSLIIIINVALILHPHNSVR